MTACLQKAISRCTLAVVMPFLLAIAFFLLVLHFFRVIDLADAIDEFFLERVPTDAR